MRVTFIGSSHGVPEPNRRCSCILLEVGENKYLIDAGTDPTAPLINAGISPAEIKAVFITHCHGDHTNGLLPFLDLCSWFYKDAKPEIYVPKMELVDALAACIEVNGTPFPRDNRITFVKEQEGLIFDDGSIRVTAMKTGHIDVSYAFLVEAEGKKVLFTGDMQHHDGPTADYARFVTEKDYALVVGEAAHFDAMLYLEPLRQYPPKLFCLNHYSWEYVESCHHLRTTLEGEIPVVLATDGLTLTV